jgi:hypothetical protein
MSSTADQVRNAGSPQEALLVIAGALDNILYELSQPKLDTPDWAAGWNSPPQTELEAQDFQDFSDVIEANKSRYQVLLDAAIANGEDTRVVEALHRLVNDENGIVQPPPSDSKLKVEDDGDLTVRFPPPDPKREAQRRTFARDVLHLEDEFPGIDAIECFVRGGPLWLYLGSKEGREFIVQLPDDLKRAMISDVAEDSASDALEMGHDLLKHRGGGPHVDMDEVIARG